MTTFGDILSDNPHFSYDAVAESFTLGSVTINSLTVDGAVSLVAGISGNIAVDDAAGAILMDEAASTTNPTLVPNQANTASGIGVRNSGTGINIVVNGAEAFNFENGKMAAGTTSSTYKVYIAATGSNITEASAFFHNTSENAAAGTVVLIKSGSTNSASGYFGVFHDGHTTTALYQNSVVIVAQSDSANGIVLNASAAGGAVKLAVQSVENLRVDGDATAGNTRLLVYDVNSTSLQRVKVGANGTGPGGTGRALYIDDTA